jgi:hypothetical protein
VGGAGLRKTLATEDTGYRGIEVGERRQLEYFLLRYVPDAVKEEFVNIGLIAFEDGAQQGRGFAEVRFTRDWQRVRCLDPQFDLPMLDALEREIQEELPDPEKRELLLKRMEDSWSGLLQISSRQNCLTENPAKEMQLLTSLFLERTKVSAPRLVSGRQEIVQAIRDAFHGAGLRGMVQEKLPVAPYSRPGDPMKFDFGYRFKDGIRLFQAVSLKAGVSDAVLLASRYPRIAPVMAKMVAEPSLTAVIDDDLDRGEDRIRFALSMMEEEKIRIAVAAEMPMIAEVARRELGA